MKSYFSQLVKHSALRYAKENTASPAPSEAKKNEREMPLERDEFVLVSPFAGESETVEHHSPQMTEPARKNSAESSELEGSKPPSPVEKSNPVNMKKSGATAAQKDASPLKAQSEAFFEAENIESKKTDLQKPLAVEEIVFKENETVEAKSAETSGLPNFYPPEIDAESKSEAAAEKRVEPAFFNKTAEILESEMTDKLEVRKILLQEINEWVSAAPALSEAEPIFTPVETKASVERDAALNVSESSNNLQEQNFELSIGTITVVVEEADNQPKVATPANEARSLEKSEPEKRGFSRLSRYYL